ncbi:Xaa-Pro peptidase family protein [Lichenihabitans sp. Uapishka_5]|uniref:M24 family metallopeptidase n=1 Tax=Lichenihabitans sp. Uapishka_5 TaxID=3037302 RepID=UPI0029E80D31|nr:Xaa-Pro peptidase family protein [Lichenihabitans sp. Uapishka_5]MDX7951548.1 Xaa-Pro peptidase family protein [Lichenihabitans sp. Uapishka_5]
MTPWCGGSDADQALARLADRTAGIRPIDAAEYQARRKRLVAAMGVAGVGALTLDASRTLTYFTGVRWSGSERLCGAVLTASGAWTFVVPAFERGTFERLAGTEASILTWEEHEVPEAMVARWLLDQGAMAKHLALDAETPFFRAERLRASLPGDWRIGSAAALTDDLRSRKSDAEIALMQRAFDITLTVQRATATILRPGIATGDVAAFVDAAHKACGVASGASFCIVLFGPDTAFPHGVDAPKVLEPGDTVLVDTGCVLANYQSDLTRTYVFGPPTPQQRRVWAHEREAQEVAFAAARLGAPCESVDDAVRRFLEQQGYGPHYRLPGLPHRTGHGLGLSIHEPPYFVRGDATPLREGMCLSIEPMLCIPDAFGVRLEDHIHMTADGPAWFTPPAASLDAPFDVA